MVDIESIATWAAETGNVSHILLLETEREDGKSIYAIVVRDEDVKPSEIIKAIFRWMDDAELDFGSREALALIRRIPC